MSYESPIGIYKTEPMIEQLRDKMDNIIFQAVQKVDVQVDRAELIKALEYDRGQYEKGFHDGRLYVPPCQTNADRIRQMSDEELADWIAQILTYHTRASSDPHKDECHTDCPLYRCCNDQPSDNIEDWLKSPVEEGEG